MRSGRLPRRALVGSMVVWAAVWALSGAVLVGPAAAPAHAAADGGASSRIVGRGDIITSIIGWRVGRPTSGAAGRPARCRWVTLRDAQIEWLAAVSASSVGTGGPNPVLDTLRHHLVDGELPDGDLQARVCAGTAVDLRFVPRDTAPSTVEVLHRRMITRLPAPDPVWSPPAHVAVPVHQPVFLSIPERDWRPVENTITVDGITARVRAEPIGLRVISGDPSGRVVPCHGPGRPFDPDSLGPARDQAAAPDTCTVTYRTATAGAGAATGPSTWIGTVTVLWNAQWRAETGPGDSEEEWVSLGVIPRTRLFDRSAREVLSSIESRPR